MNPHALLICILQSVLIRNARGVEAKAVVMDIDLGRLSDIGVTSCNDEMLAAASTGSGSAGSPVLPGFRG